MKSIEVKKLLEKFYNGETSLNEEQLLRDYVEQDKIPEQFSEIKEYFKVVRKEKEQTLDESFERIFFSAVDETVPGKSKSRVWIYRIGGIAATVLILIWLGVETFRPKQVYGTIKDPVLAFHETRLVLNQMAAEMNKNIALTEKSINTINKSFRKVYELNTWNRVMKKTENVYQKSNNALSKTNI